MTISDDSKCSNLTEKAQTLQRQHRRHWTKYDSNDSYKNHSNT